MATRNPGRNLLAMAVLATLGSMPLSAVHAQTVAAAPDGANEDEATTLDKIVVTAQKREEALQDVPITLTVLPEQLLQDSGVRDIKNLQNLVPGMNVISTGSEASTAIRIRGVGTTGDNPGLESSVGVVIDGVYRPRSGVGFGDLGELERIEVLKGPQGTLFGKNTSAGVVNIITRRPSYSQSAEAELTVGNYGAIGVAGSYNDAISDSAAFRIYATKRKRDGFLDVHNGEGPRIETDDNDQNVQSVRAQLLLEPTDNLDINIIGDFASREENCCGAVSYIRGGTAPILDALVGGDAVSATPADPYARIAYENRSSRQDIKDKGISAEINWQTPWLNGATLTSITSKRDWKVMGGADSEFSSADIIHRDFDKNSVQFKTFTQEFRLAGSTDNLDWMVGYFHANEDMVRQDSVSMGKDYYPYWSLRFGLPAGTISALTGLTNEQLSGVGYVDNYKHEATSDALFGNFTFKVTDALNLTAGVRYTNEKKELDSVYTNPNGGLGCLAALQPGFPASLIGIMCLPNSNILHNGRVTHQERDEKEWSGTLKADYRWNEHAMTFVSAARGYKAGGFNLDRVQSATGLNDSSTGIVPSDDTSFEGEFVDSFELGAKTTWMDGNLLVNAALFHETFTDYQMNTFLGLGYTVLSLDELVSQGIDTEVLWQASKGLLVQGGVTYNDARFADELAGAAFAPGGDFAKLPGTRVPLAPYWSATMALTYERSLGSSLDGNFHIGAKYVSPTNTGADKDAEKYQGGYTVVNARLGIAGKGNRWAVELWGENLTDAEYAQVIFDAPFQTGWDAFLGAPRTYGVTFRVSY